MSSFAVAIVNVASPLKGFYCSPMLILVLTLLFNILTFSVNAAPISTDSSSSQALTALETEVVENIMQAKLDNKCETDQDRKDICERCIRFVFERPAGYLGCCTNYDGIYNFCEQFLNYSYDESVTEAKSKKLGKSVNEQRIYQRK